MRAARWGAAHSQRSQRASLSNKLAHYPGTSREFRLLPRSDTGAPQIGTQGGELSRHRAPHRYASGNRAALSVQWASIHRIPERGYPRVRHFVQLADHGNRTAEAVRSRRLFHPIGNTFEASPRHRGKARDVGGSRAPCRARFIRAASHDKLARSRNLVAYSKFTERGPPVHLDLIAWRPQ